MEPRRLRTEKGEIICLEHLQQGSSTKKQSSLRQYNLKQVALNHFSFYKRLPLNAHLASSWKLSYSSMTLDI